jgi:predicted ATPase
MAPQIGNISTSEAELYRLQGELLLQRTVSDTSQAATCFQRTLAIARLQQAKSLELRATMSLSRLWQQQGERQNAHDLLARYMGGLRKGLIQRIYKRPRRCWMN